MSDTCFQPGRVTVDEPPLMLHEMTQTRRFPRTGSVVQSWWGVRSGPLWSVVVWTSVMVM